MCQGAMARQAGSPEGGEGAGAGRGAGGGCPWPPWLALSPSCLPVSEAGPGQAVKAVEARGCGRLGHWLDRRQLPPGGRSPGPQWGSNLEKGFRVKPSHQWEVSQPLGKEGESEPAVGGQAQGGHGLTLQRAGSGRRCHVGWAV